MTSLTRGFPRILTGLVIVAGLLPLGTHTGTPEPLNGWRWPVSGQVRIIEPYVQPEHRYASGHRGIDLAADGPVNAPAAGTIAFAGPVAGRGIVTIAHDGGYVTTLEPVVTELTTGDTVAAGDFVGAVATGGHTPSGAVHFGVRLDGEYVNPAMLVGDVPAAVLLPCCS